MAVEPSILTAMANISHLYLAECFQYAFNVFLVEGCMNLFSGKCLKREKV